MHSTYSDGEQTPEEVVCCAKEAGLSAIAITDHNVFTFTKPFVRDGMKVIPGIEFSAEYYVPPWDDSTEIHVALQRQYQQVLQSFTKDICRTRIA